MTLKDRDFIIQASIIERILIFTVLISFALGVNSGGQVQPPDHVVISEVYPNPEVSSKGEFVELYNPTDNDINLSGWKLEDNDGKSCEFVGTILSHGFYLVVYDNDEYKKDNGSWPDADEEILPYYFLSNGGDELRLKDSNGTVIDTVGYGSKAEWSETSPFTPVPNEGESLERKSLPGSSAPRKDTNDNSEDFQILTSPSPAGTTSNRFPIADFTFSPTSPTTQDTIQFTDQSSDTDGTIASWNWDFGD